MPPAALPPEAESISRGEFIGKWAVLLGPAAGEIAAGAGRRRRRTTMTEAGRRIIPDRVAVRSSTLVAVLPGTRLAVAAMVLGMRMPGAEVAVVAMLVAAVPMPGPVLMPGGVGVVAVAAMRAMVVAMPGAVVAVAVVVVRNEDEGGPGKMVPMSVPAAVAAGMRRLVARTLSPRFVQYPVEGSRGNSEENGLAGRKVMAGPPAFTWSLTGERRLEAESSYREQGRERGQQGRSWSLHRSISSGLA